MTGGLGFIGSHLVESLSKKNHKIMVLTKTLSKRSKEKTMKFLTDYSKSVRFKLI